MRHARHRSLPSVNQHAVAMVGIVSADLISGFLECTLYGIFVVLSTTSMVLLVRRHHATYGSLVRIQSRSFLKRVMSAWTLRQSPLLLVTGVLMLTITAVRNFITTIVASANSFMGILISILSPPLIDSFSQSCSTRTCPRLQHS